MITVHAWMSLQETFEARASEWFLSCILFSLGLVCMMNLDLFITLNFTDMGAWFSQRTWAFIFFFVSVLRLSVLFINGAYWRTPHFRSILAFMSCFIWFQLVLAFASSGSFLAAIMPWIFLLDAYNVLRSGREAGIAQYLHYARKKDKGSDRATHDTHA